MYLWLWKEVVPAQGEFVNSQRGSHQLDIHILHDWEGNCFGNIDGRLCDQRPNWVKSQNILQEDQTWLTKSYQ